MQLNHSSVTGPQGAWRVSTVQTFSGGAAASKSPLSPFSSADYADETPWPFETMVFRPAGGTGYFHRAYSDRQSALDGHTEVVHMCATGTLPIGSGVSGTFGNPTLTATEWNARAAK